MRPSGAQSIPTSDQDSVAKAFFLYGRAFPNDDVLMQPTKVSIVLFSMTPGAAFITKEHVKD